MTTDTDKLVEMALKSGAVNHFVQSLPDRYAFSLSELTSFRAAIIASLCGDVEPVAFMFQHSETGRVTFVDAWQKENGWAAANPRYSEVGALHGASTVAALKARVAELEKDVIHWKEARQNAMAAGELMLAELEALRSKK